MWSVPKPLQQPKRAVLTYPSTSKASCQKVSKWAMSTFQDTHSTAKFLSLKILDHFYQKLKEISSSTYYIIRTTPLSRRHYVVLQSNTIGLACAPTLKGSVLHAIHARLENSQPLSKLELGSFLSLINDSRRYIWTW